MTCAFPGGAAPKELGPLSVQYWDADSRQLYVANDRTPVERMHSLEHKWRVLVLGLS